MHRSKKATERIEDLSAKIKLHLVEIQQFRSEQRFLHLAGREAPEARRVDLGPAIKTMQGSFIDMFSKLEWPKEAAAKKTDVEATFAQMPSLVQQMADLELSLETAMLACQKAMGKLQKLKCRRALR